MNKDKFKNVIILKNLPSNLIDEAIVVVKDRKKIKDLDYSELIKDGGEKFSIYDKKQQKNRTIQGYIKEEDLNKIEKIKKEERKYVIKEAELIITNYLNKIERPISDKNINKLENSYKIVKKLNILLGMTTIVSIILAIAI